MNSAVTSLARSVSSDCRALGDRVEHAVEEAAADHGRDLQHLLGFVLEAIDAGEDDALDGVGQQRRVELPGHGPRAGRGVLLDRAGGLQRADQLAQEERIACRAAQQHLPRGRRQRPAAQEVAASAARFVLGQRRQASSR